MKSQISGALSRAKYAAIGAAIGAAVGGLVSRNTASTGGALGGLVGASIADARNDPNGFLSELRPGGDEESTPADEKSADESAA